MKINKDYLVNYVTKSLKSEFSKDDVKFITEKIFEVIANSLSEGNRIEIRGFGSFSLRDRMVPKDPRDNKSSNSDRIKCSSVYFRMSKNMADQIKDV